MLNNDLYFMTNNFYPNKSGLFQDNNVPFQKAQKLIQGLMKMKSV